MYVHVVDYMRMRVYDIYVYPRLTISSYEHHSLACLIKADGASADGLFMQ